MEFSLGIARVGHGANIAIFGSNCIPTGVGAGRPKWEDPTLRLAFDAHMEIRCPFLAIAIRNAALARHYPGGVKGFMNRHPAVCNRNLTVYHGLGFDFEELTREMMFWGIAQGRDFALVDAISYGWAMACGRIRRKVPHDVDFAVPWLKGRYTDDGFWVRAARHTVQMPAGDPETGPASYTGTNRRS